MWRERPTSIGNNLQEGDGSSKPRRRLGCGCLPLVVLFFFGSFLLRAVEGLTDTDIDGGLVVMAVIVGFVVLAIAGARRRSRTQERRDTVADGAPTSTRRADVPVPARVEEAAYAPPPPASPVRRPSPGESIPVEPRLEPETESLRRRLTDAVADIASEVDDVAPGGAPGKPSSEEMIAAAKRRIREMGARGSTPGDGTRPGGR